MPAGGVVQPDGRTPRAKGVGKNAKRHDLERPATPGLSNSDLQSGDVQMLEQGQKVAPRAGSKKVNGAGPVKSSNGPRRQGAQRGSGQFSMAVPDPVEMAGDRMGGNPAASGGSGVVYDPTPWLPMVRTLAGAPNSGGPIAASLVRLLSQYRQKPQGSVTNVIDFNELDDVLGG